MSDTQLARDLPDRRTGDRSPSGEEELRFIRSFHDVFLSIGLAMFAVGLGFVTSLTTANIIGDVGIENWRRAGSIIAAVSFANAIIMWVLAEFFARSRRLFLPAIIILLAFVTFTLVGVFSLYTTMFGDQNINGFESALSRFRALPLTLSLTAAVATLVYYLRMRLPFAMGLGGMALAAAGVSLYGFIYPDNFLKNYLWLQLWAGVFLFVLGVAFDARDPERRTRLSDNGFWLHFFAAPLIFGSVIGLTTGFGGPVSGAVFGGASGGGQGAALMTLIVVSAFAIVSLLINRRALLVAGLISAGVAIAVLVKETGLDGAWTAGVTLLLLGAAMVLLGGGWRTVRGILVAPFPKSGPISRIVPPETGDLE